MTQQYEPYPPDAFLRHYAARTQAEGIHTIHQQNEIEKKVGALIEAGFTTIIPSDHLLDGEILVPRDVYEAYKGMMGLKK